MGKNTSRGGAFDPGEDLPSGLLQPLFPLQQRWVTWNRAWVSDPSPLRHGHAERQTQSTLPVAGLAHQQLSVVNQRRAAAGCFTPDPPGGPGPPQRDHQPGSAREPTWVDKGKAHSPNTLFIRLCLFQTIWDEHDNRTRLAERIDIVNRWKEMLDKCLTDLDAEIDALTQAGSKTGDLETSARTYRPSPLLGREHLMGVFGGRSI